MDYHNFSRFEIFLEFCKFLLALLKCLIFGHDLIDLDPGNAEVGPQPNIQCNRCYKKF